MGFEGHKVWGKGPRPRIATLVGIISDTYNNGGKAWTLSPPTLSDVRWQALCWCCYQCRDMSVPEIKRQVGWASHTSVLACIRQFSLRPTLERSLLLARIDDAAEMDYRARCRLRKS